MIDAKGHQSPKNGQSGAGTPSEPSDTEKAAERAPVVILDEWELMARGGRLADAIEEYVRQHDWVTFVEIRNRFAGIVNMDGPHALASGTDPNLIFWADMSEEYVDGVRRLLEEKRVHPHPSQWLTYVIDGGALSLPVAKRIPRGGLFKKEHWLPTVLRLVPSEAAK